MRYGVHAYVMTDRWTDASVGLLERVRELGIGCVEIAVGDDVAFDAGATRRAAEALGLELVVSPGGEWPAVCNLASESAEERRQGLAWHRQQLERGAELGAVAYTGALYGHVGTVKLHPPSADEMAWMTEGLRALAERGEALGLVVVIEPMSHFRTHLVNTPEQAVQLLQRVDHGNLQVLFDTYHMVTEVRDFAAGLQLLRPYLWGLHACENDRGAPGGGLVPWEAIFGELKASGFDGYVVLEAYNSGIPGFAHSRRMFHDVCPDGEAFIRQGLRFLRTGLER